MAKFADLQKQYPDVFGDPKQQSESTNTQPHQSDFIAQVRPVAERVGRELNVNPDFLMAQFAGETGWGKSVIPGTYNLGNIKDFSGGGVAATDNMTGSRDKYRKYGSYDEFGDDYISLIKRLYPAVIGAGDDIQKFGAGLVGGKRKYAEDPRYIEKLTDILGSVRKRMQNYAPAASSPAVQTQPPVTPAYSAPFVPTGVVANRHGEVRRARLPEPEDFLTNNIALREEERKHNAPYPDRSVLAAVNDTVIETANAATGLAKAGVDLVAPGSWLSEGMEDFVKHGESKQSDMKKAQRERLNYELANAGSEIEKAEVFLKHAITQDPLGTVGQVIGNIGPFGIAGRAMSGLNYAGRTAGMMGLAGGLSAGEVRGNIYDEITKTPDADLMKKSPEYAEMRKRLSEKDAKEVLGTSFAKYAPEIIAAGLVGAAGGKFGIEGMAAGLAPARGRLANAIIGVADEASQGAVEQLATNYGVQRVIPEQSLTENVMLNAAAEGILGIGGVAVNGKAHAAPKPNSPLSNAALAATTFNQANDPGIASGNVAQDSVAPRSLGTQGDLFGPGVAGQTGIAGEAAAQAEQGRVLTFEERLAEVKPVVESREFIREVRDTPEFGSESVQEMLSAYAVAANPNLEPFARNSALSGLERFIQVYNNRPNFVMGERVDSADPIEPGTGVAAVEAGAGAAVPTTFAGDTQGNGPGAVYEGEIIPESTAIQAPPPALRAFDVANLVKEGWVPAEKSREMISPEGTETRPLNAVQYAVAREAFRRVQAGRAQGISADEALDVYRQFELNRARYQEGNQEAESVRTPEPSMADLYHAGYYEEGLNEGGLSAEGEEVLSDFREAVDADYWGFDVQDILRVLGFSEEQIYENTRGSRAVFSGNEGEVGEVAGGRTEASPAEDAGDGALAVRGEEEGVGASPIEGVVATPEPVVDQDGQVGAIGEPVISPVADAGTEASVAPAEAVSVTESTTAEDGGTVSPGSITETKTPDDAHSLPVDSRQGDSAGVESDSAPESVSSNGKEKGRTRIDDFGEKIGGARKDIWGGFREKMERAMETDILSAPLSESWPAPDYQSLIDNGADPFAVAFIRACRDQLPSKPRMRVKVRQWAENVSFLRELSNDLINGTVDLAAVKNLLNKAAEVSRGMRGIGGRIDLYLAVGHQQSLSGISLAAGKYSIYNGVEYNPSKVIWTVSKQTSSTWPKDLASGNTREEAIESFKSRYDEIFARSPVSKDVTFDVFTKNGEFFVGKKIGRNPALLAGPFKMLSEARGYKDQNTEALVEKLEKFKEVPVPRRDANNPRVGEDMREGVDVTPELFSDTFGFRGVEFGNWVEQKKRQEDLNNTYDALMDMAAILGIPPKAISLNGELAIAFGARGKGSDSSAAHYEEGKVVINLTKKNGAGSLGHEWWHALDNYFSRMGGNRFGFMTEGVLDNGSALIRKEMVEAFKSIKHEIYATAIRARSRKLDAKRTRAYWVLSHEMSARAFESYLISKLQDQNASNDYLANIVDEETWKAAEALGFELGESYPYPTAGEIPKIRGAFDHFFQTVESRETERGVALFRSDQSDFADSKEEFSRAEADGFVEKFLRLYPAAPEIVVTNTFSQLPEHVRKDAGDQGGSPQSVKGVFADGKVYLVAGNHHSLADFEATVFHEVVGHAGVRKLFGREFIQELNQVLLGLGGMKGVARIMESRGLGRQAQSYMDGIAAARENNPEAWSDLIAKSVLTEEVFAHIAEQMKDRPGLRDKFMTLVGKIRAWLRDNGFSRLSSLGESDLLFMLSKARKTMEGSGYSSERSRVVVSGPDLINPATGGRIDPNHPDFEAALRLADLLGLKHEPGVAVFAARRIRGGVRSVNDAVVPETPEYDGNTTGDLAFFPGSRTGIEGLPIRIVVGSAKGKHAGFGILHVQDNIARDSRRAPQEQTGDMAEDIVREVVRVLKSPGMLAYKEGERVILQSPSLKKAIVLEVRENRGERFYSVVTERPAPKNIWGRPEWIGRLTFPSRESTANSPSTAQRRQDNETPRPDRNGLEATSEHLNISREVEKNQPVVTVKKRRKIEIDGGPTVLRSAADFHDYFNSGDARRSIRGGIGKIFKSLSIGKSAKTFNWWHRTVGSQYHKARISPEFRRVYDMAHEFVDDVSRFANQAADQAKSILPHLDNWRDMVSGMNPARAFRDSADYKAIAPAIFQGTLANGTTGKVWTNQELVDDFGLNEKQIGLYREFRAAVDTSLEILAKSEMARFAKTERLELANPNMSLDESLEFYLDQGMSRESEGVFKGKVEQIRQLQSEGYAPLMRFGKYTVDVVRLDESGNPVLDENGEPVRPFFGMFESQAEAIEAEKILQEEYPGFSVSRGILSEENSRLYKGITPETAELFAKLLQSESHEAFQTYLKQAVANRSAMKRLINRKGMDGFAEDVPRVLSGFITSTAKLASGNWHFGDMAKAANEIPNSMGDVKDEAIRVLDYIQNPKEEASWIRGLLFFNFLGGSVAAAMVNTTQTFSTTLPYLHQFGPKETVAAITKAMGIASRAMTKGLQVVKDADLRSALERAASEGVVDPQEIHLLMAEAGGNGASNLVGRAAGAINSGLAAPATRFTRSFTYAWGSFFSMAEKYNRHVAFMAAWDVAGNMSNEDLAKAGASSRYEFAKNAVIETQFDYTKVSRPNWARGPVGATLFTFKTFMINYLEFVARLPPRERLVAIAVLVLLSGLSGLPFADDAGDLLDAIAQKFGYNWNTSASVHSWLMKTLGEGGANFVEHGISSFVPIDVSARLGMGNLIPGTEVFKKSSTDKGRDAAEFFGPAGNVAAGALKVFDDLGTGKDFSDLIRPVAPKAYNDVAKAMDMLNTGYYRDAKGRKVVAVDTVDALFKAIGFQPNAVAEPRRVQWMINQSSQMQKATKSDIYELWAAGVFEKDQGKVESARRRLLDWNKKNPETPIYVNPDSIRQRVKAMRSSSASRMVKATSKEMRGMVRDAIAVGE